MYHVLRMVRGGLTASAKNIDPSPRRLTWTKAFAIDHFFACRKTSISRDCVVFYTKWNLWVPWQRISQIC